MKRILKTLIALTFVVMLLESLTLKVNRKEGAEPGYTGSPGDSLKNCTFCHGGSTTEVDGWITSDIPATGYKPGETYTITTTNTEVEGTRFGFQISPQNFQGDLLGTLVLSDTVQTQLVGSGKYITYTANGVEGNGSKTWSFKWIAPKKGTRNVTFYGAYNSNFQGHKDGDKTFLSALNVQEEGFIGVEASPILISNFNVYPNPANNKISIRFNVKEKSALLIDVTDITGKQIAIILDEVISGSVIKEFNTSALANGNYFIRLKANDRIMKQTFTVYH